MNMFKKLAVLGGALCAAGLLTVAPALAGVVGSRHDVTSTHANNTYRVAFSTLAEFGTCSACHIPHGAGADKLFPQVATGGIGNFFGPLCGSCHDSNAFSGGGVNLYVNNTAFDANAHGLDIADLQAQGADYALTSAALKYLAEEMTTGGIECLSCHDVHNQQGNRPFLLVSIDTLCQECHLNRANNDTATTGFANPLSTHPAGAVFTGDMGTDSGVVKTGNSSPMLAAGLSTLVVTNVDAGSDGSTWPDASWNSGAHFEGGTGVGCVTCHTVHWDEVTLDNGSEYLGFVDGGQAGLENNAFCEACHQGSNATSSGSYYWNPGGTVYSHPNDDVRATALTPADVGGFPLAPSNTTSASSGDGTVSALVCTSCHGVHPSDTGGSPSTQPNTPILLAYTSADICTECHNSATLPFMHHPVGAGVYATAGNNADGVTCNGGDLGAGIGTCHGGNGGGAHNRPSPLAGGLDTNYSAMCVICHSTNPSIYTEDSSTFNSNGEATHFVGDASLESWTRTTGMAGGGASGAIRWAGDQSTWDGSTLTSKLGANNTTIICESCHRLAAGNIMSGDDDVNGVTPYDTATSMLVEVAGAAIDTDTADATVEVADYTDAPYLCTGCHLVPAGTHPLADADNSRYTISADAAGQFYPTTGLNCESCHSPHDANTSSGSYILDGTLADGQTTFGSNADGQAVEPTIDYTTFCAVCHSDFE